MGPVLAERHAHHGPRGRVDLPAAQGETLAADRVVQRATGRLLLRGVLPGAGAGSVEVPLAAVEDVEWADGVLGACAWLLGIVSGPPIRLPAPVPVVAAELYRRATGGRPVHQAG